MNTLFLLMAERYSIVLLDRDLFIRSFGLFQTHSLIPLGRTAWSGIAGSYDNSVFNLGSTSTPNAARVFAHAQ